MNVVSRKSRISIDVRHKKKGKAMDQARSNSDVVQSKGKKCSVVPFFVLSVSINTYMDRTAQGRWSLFH